MGSHVDSNGLLTEVRFPLPNGDSPSTSPTDRRLYEYNALGEAKKFTDPNGGGQTTPLYDNNGNMTRDEAGRTFVYDAWDRLVVEGNTSLENVRYTYDARGYRTERMAGGVSTYYHYTHDWQLLEERGVGSGPGQTVAT